MCHRHRARNRVLFSVLVGVAFLLAFPGSGWSDGRGKMCASLVRAVEGRSDVSRLMRTVPGITLAGNIVHITVFIEMTAVPASLEDYGVQLLTRADTIYLARLPLANLEAVASLSGVVRLEADAWVEPFLDLSVPDIRANEVWAEQKYGNLQGEEVIVGMVDTGISSRHQDFLETDGSGLSRIRWVWDQGDPTGPAPQETCRDYTRDPPPQVPCGGTECSPRNQGCDVVDIGDHGTLVMGAMAGNGQGGCPSDQDLPCAGVAPKGEIIVVKPGELMASEVIQGVDYIFQKASEAGMPAVVNLSLGWYSGSRDGNSLLERNLSNLTGPGRIIVTSAGNQALEMAHARFSSDGANEQQKRLTLDCAPRAADKVVLYGWYNAPSAGSIQVRAVKVPLSVSTAWVGFRDPGWDDPDKEPDLDSVYGKVTIWHGETSGDARGFTILLESPSPLWGGEWDIEVRNQGASELGTAVDVWVDRTFDVGPSSGTCPKPARFREADQERETTIGPPCTADDVICVASYNTRCIQGFCTGCSLDYPETQNCSDVFEKEGDISSFSSMGPARDGDRSPWLAAPGNAILTPDNRGAATYSYAQGTSFSAPHVAGTVALMLQGNPNLTPSEVLGALQDSARMPDGISAWDAAWGWGRLDAYGAVAEVVEEIPPPEPHGLGGGDDICFVATAVFGDIDAPQVELMRELRDRFLVRISLGRQFVRSYYRWSPPVAAWLKEHAMWSRTVRLALMPAVGISEIVCHRDGVGWAVLWVIGLLLLTTVCYSSLKRRIR